MAEISRFWTTNGIGDGPDTEYTANNFADFCSAVFTDGVLARVLKELVCEKTTNQVTLKRGAAIVAGRFYRNSTNLDIAVPTPASARTGFRLVLRADWALNTVRAYVKMSSDGNPSPPPIVENEGVEWEVSIYTGDINTSGYVRVYDARVWAEYSLTLAEDSVTGLQLALLSVTSDKIKDEAIIAQSMSDYQIETNRISDNAVSTVKIGDGVIFGEHFAADALIGNLNFMQQSVTWQKLGINTLRMLLRKGSSALDWSLAGTQSYSDMLVEIQVGSFRYFLARNDRWATQEISFRYPYADGAPIVMTTVNYISGGYSLDTKAWVYAVDKSTVSFAIQRDDYSKVPTDGEVYWMAVGGQLA